ncbi:hypothetical protein J0A68_04730 [Algoriphagus sp. H41]|uniref:Uncharacterized protein n=1 Tax=Algoriphagus oliviformis TaxID=2811231 RepID=A0ABS3C3T6_9BACT|nr:hypothetical protein [Algoriphagus oliviformis]MBN7810249.1 hypothetical protein [Algoriphagus oliviformis]
MRIERTDKEIIIRIPADVDIAELDKILDYIKFRAIASKSAASDSEIDELAQESKSTWWEENKKRFVK